MNEKFRTGGKLEFQVLVTKCSEHTRFKILVYGTQQIQEFSIRQLTSADVSAIQASYNAAQV